MRRRGHEVGVEKQGGGKERKRKEGWGRMKGKEIERRIKETQGHVDRKRRKNEEWGRESCMEH